MNITTDMIRAAARGISYISEEVDGVKLHRFNPDEENYYKTTKTDFYVKSLSTAGVKLAFYTDATALALTVNAEKGSSREYYSFTVRSDGKTVGYIDNFSDHVFAGNYTADRFLLGEISGRAELNGNARKLVEIIFPWSAKVTLKSLSLENASFIEPYRREKILLAYGDSITQGYDAVRPEMRYASILADMLSADEINKGIGGEIFAPELAKLADTQTPDYVTVAYGTNDWGKVTPERFLENAASFYLALSEKYPDAKIFAVTPIWRADHTEKRPFGPFAKIADLIGEAVKDLPNVNLISGFDLVPESRELFGDLRLHPNDRGFEYYARSLYAKIKGYV